MREGYKKTEILKNKLKYTRVGMKFSNIKGRFKNLLPGTYKVFYKPTLIKKIILKGKKPNKNYIIKQTGWREFQVGETVRLEPDTLAYRVSVNVHSGKLGFQYAGIIEDTNLCDLLYVKGAMYGVIKEVSKNGQVAEVSRITR